MTKFLSVERVRAELAKAGTKIVSVKFEKKNGDIAERAGRQNTRSRRVDLATADQASVNRSMAASKALADQGAVFLDYMRPDQNDGKHGFRFDLDKVIAIGEIQARD